MVHRGTSAHRALEHSEDTVTNANTKVDLTNAEVYTERGRSIARGTWHVIPGPDTPLVYFVSDDTKTPRPAIITLDMLRDKTRFEHLR
jgi:hypothetical protein